MHSSMTRITTSETLTIEGLFRLLQLFVVIYNEPIKIAIFVFVTDAITIFLLQVCIVLIMAWIASIVLKNE